MRPFGRVLDEIEDAAPLYLGMLLHDVGKGHGGGHVERGARMAPRACARLGLDERATEDVVFLVAAHLEMSQISQHRDLTETASSPSFAERVGSVHRLNLLHVLTYADHRAVAPGIWNEWKGALLWELYDRTRQHLAGHPGGRRPRGDGPGARDREPRAPSSRRPTSSATSPSSPSATSAPPTPPRMARHFRLVSGRGEAPAAFEWRDLADGHCTELTLVTDDRPGLLAQRRRHAHRPRGRHPVASTSSTGATAS